MQLDAEAILQIDSVSKRFGSQLANDAISFDLHRGEILALLGENGAGKTTLMNVLFGHYRADGGHIRVHGAALENHTPDDALQAGIGMVHQHFALAGQLSVLDNVMLGTESLWQPFTRRAAARRRLQQIIERSGLEVDLDGPVRDLAVGERQRVEILKALYRDVSILILDEPTAVLAPQEVDRLFALLRSMAADGLAIILISHKLDEVLAISDRVVVLRGGQHVGEARTDTVDRDSLAHMIVGRRIVRPVAEAQAAGPVRVSIRGGRVAGERGARALLDAVDLDLPGGQITGLAGISGNGQSTLADVLSGLRSLDAGDIEIDGQRLESLDARTLTHLGVARIPEDRQRLGVIGELSLWENLMLDELGEPPIWRAGAVLDRRAALRRATTLVNEFDVRCRDVTQPAALLSGGNMQKLILARNLARKPSVILANQPARGLDEGAIASVHRHLIEARARGVAVLLISEDLDEVLRLADRVVVIQGGRLSPPLDRESLDTRRLGRMMSGLH